MTTHSDYCLDGNYSLAKLPNPVGMLLVMIECLFSGLAGVLCEKFLKTGNASIAIRNVQLGVPSFVFGLVALYNHGKESVVAYGFFQGSQLGRGQQVCLKGDHGHCYEKVR